MYRISSRFNLALIPSALVLAVILLGVAALTFDPRGRLTRQDWQPVTLSPDIADDPAMTDWVTRQLNP